MFQKTGLAALVISASIFTNAPVQARLITSVTFSGVGTIEYSYVDCILQETMSDTCQNGLMEHMRAENLPPVGEIFYFGGSVYFDRPVESTGTYVEFNSVYGETEGKPSFTGNIYASFHNDKYEWIDYPGGWYDDPYFEPIFLTLENGYPTNFHTNYVYGYYSTVGISSEDGLVRFHNWIWDEFAGTAEAEDHIEAWGNIGGSGQITKLTVTYAAVPEPENWALMIAGFGLIGLSVRRRQSINAA